MEPNPPTPNTNTNYYNCYFIFVLCTHLTIHHNKHILPIPIPPSSTKHRLLVPLSDPDHISAPPHQRPPPGLALPGTLTHIRQDRKCNGALASIQHCKHQQQQHRIDQPLPQHQLQNPPRRAPFLSPCLRFDLERFLKQIQSFVQDRDLCL